MNAIVAGMKNYSELVRRANERTLVGRINAVLGWDQETYLPPAAVKYRADQSAYLSGKFHRLATDVELVELLENARNEISERDSLEWANLENWQFEYERATCLSADLVERWSRLTSEAKAAWGKARASDDFSLFAPYFKKLVDLAREKAECYGYEDEPYDALLLGFERGINTREVAAIFDPLKDQLKPLITEVLERQRAAEIREFEGEFPAAAQRGLIEEILSSIGFDLESGRLDETLHPFCTELGPEDVRLTVRYDLGDPLSGILAALHEAGHGMYAQGTNKEQYGLPCGEPVSLGIHESQSRLWENHVGRSRAFWQHWLPRAVKFFPQLADWTIDQWMGRINRAGFSFIRVECDPLTYDFHIMLRFAIERALLNRELEVDEVPEFWNAAFAKDFGIQVKRAADGCLQDIHWSMGAIGYFPTYSLGNIYAAQIFAKAAAVPAIDAAIQAGDYLPLRDWLRTQIHQHGSRFLPVELLERATGQAPSADAYLASLRARYLPEKGQ